MTPTYDTVRLSWPVSLNIYNDTHHDNDFILYHSMFYFNLLKMNSKTYNVTYSKTCLKRLKKEDQNWFSRTSIA